MAWLVPLMIMGFLWNRMEDEQSLQEIRRLLRCIVDEHPENVKQLPESPSPHQLLGEIARPFAPMPHGRRAIEIAFRCRRDG